MVGVGISKYRVVRAKACQKINSSSINFQAMALEVVQSVEKSFQKFFLFKVRASPPFYGLLITLFLKQKEWTLYLAYDMRKGS